MGGDALGGVPGQRRAAALAEAALVTFLWSTSWVLIKVGLDDLSLPPLSFAGLRYALATLVLLTIAWPSLRRVAWQSVDTRLRWRVVFLGVLLYAVTQGAQFAALVHLPAVAVSLALSTTPVVVAIVGLGGREAPSRAQIAGAAAVAIGAALYFGPLDLGAGAAAGLAVAAIGVGANAASAVLGRALARDALPALGGAFGLTALSMAAGSIPLLLVGLAIDGPPSLTVEAWLIIAWLAVVNTAFAFTLWNHSLRTLTAIESSVMNSVMLVQIAALAWLFLGESLDGRELVGLAIALAGILAVQLSFAAPRRLSAADGAASPHP
jgi:drug/metabolite transporter (DMT)-like permease